MVQRLLITSVLLLASAAYRVHATQAEMVPPREPLRAFPFIAGDFRGQDLPALESNILKILGADEYLNRIYAKAPDPWVGLYVGYYESQRQGDSIHSPLNCLPGAGWQPVQQHRTSFDVTDAAGRVQSITVNQFVIQKGLDRQMVLYWYQSQGRVIASEYTSKMYMVYDAMRRNRTDAALVRVITPIVGDDSAGEQAALGRVTAFAQSIFPSLTRTLPS